jgi:hypothetical protein
MSKFSVISWREQVAFLYDDDDDDDVRFALDQHAELDNSCLVYVICVCLRIEDLVEAGKGHSKFYFLNCYIQINNLLYQITKQS